MSWEFRVVALSRDLSNWTNLKTYAVIRSSRPNELKSSLLTMGTALPSPWVRKMVVFFNSSNALLGGVTTTYSSFPSDESEYSHVGPSNHKGSLVKSVGVAPLNGRSAGLLFPLQWLRDLIGMSFCISTTRLRTNCFHSLGDVIQYSATQESV